MKQKKESNKENQKLEGLGGKVRNQPKDLRVERIWRIRGIWSKFEHESHPLTPTHGGVKIPK